MGVLDWMCLIDDWNFWKASVDMEIFLEDLQKGISYTVSYLTSFHGGNEVTGFKAQDVTRHRHYSREGQLAANGRSSNNHGTGVKFMYFCIVFFTFNKYSEFLVSLVIGTHETMGLCEV
jgi:hypothetical protein